MMRLTFCIIVGTIVIANSIRAAYVGKKTYQLNPRSLFNLNIIEMWHFNIDYRFDRRTIECWFRRNEKYWNKSAGYKNKNPILLFLQKLCNKEPSQEFLQTEISFTK